MGWYRKPIPLHLILPPEPPLPDELVARLKAAFDKSVESATEVWRLPVIEDTSEPCIIVLDLTEESS